MNGIFNGNRLLKIEEVAEVLGIKPKTVASWVAQGRIPYIKFGELKSQKCVIRFNPKRLNRWLEDLSHEPGEDKIISIESKKTRRASLETVERFKKFAANM